MSLRKIIMPDFATKDWFRTYQLPLKFAINHPRPVKREYYRDKFGLIHLDPRISISKITPNAAHYRVEKDQVQAVIYSGNVFEWALKREFEKIFYPLHKFDLQIANRFIPVLNLGYDTLTQYSTVADGYVAHGGGPTWATVRSDTTGASSATNSTAYSLAIRGEKVAGTFYISRSFTYHDTSSIGAGTITAVVMSVRGYQFNDLPEVCAMKGTQADSLSTSDYDNFSGNYYGKTSAWSTSVYNTITFDSTGISDIVKDGTTKICLRNYAKDYLNSEPTGYGSQGMVFADQTGNTSDPKLEITYTPASAVGARSGGIV